MGRRALGRAALTRALRAACDQLFLTSLIAFIAPHSSTQVIVACMFAFGMLLLTISVRPYKEPANNLLATLSQIKCAPNCAEAPPHV